MYKTRFLTNTLFCTRGGALRTVYTLQCKVSKYHRKLGPSRTCFFLFFSGAMSHFVMCLKLGQGGLQWAELDPEFVPETCASSSPRHST